jgi:hypothetical protein
VFVHRIDYVLGALEAKGNRRWTLDHDFAFRERPGNIERFGLRLELDGNWISKRPSPVVIERGQLAPGESVVVRLPLEYTGTRLQDPPSRSSRAWESAREWLVDVRMSFAGAFAKFRRELRTSFSSAFSNLRRGLTVDVRLWVAALFSTLLGGLAQALFQRARDRGHFAPLRGDADIDAGSIEKHLLPHEPEVVGAAYDREIGSAEVMAVLARLEREGKLTSTVDKRQLQLELRAPRDAFVGYERMLVEKLFFAGDHTSTAMIRSHYRNFDPAEVLRRSLSPKVDAVLGRMHCGPEDSPSVLKLTAVAAGLALISSSHDILQHSFPSGGVVMFFGIPTAFIIGVARARRFRDRLDPPILEARFLRRWFIAFGAVVVAVAMLSPYMAPIDFVTHFGSAFALALLVVWSGWPKDTAVGMALRKRIAEARRYFNAQLRTRHPRLDDAWYPYMIALGLSPELDSWFAAFGREPQPEKRAEESSPNGSSVTFDSTSSARSEGAEPARWTGGGGRFGGGGASGSWGSAAAELAAGISISSSSSSSSRSSGTSGSSSRGERTSRSGGGSAGGW